MSNQKLDFIEQAKKIAKAIKDDEKDRGLGGDRMDFSLFLNGIFMVYDVIDKFLNFKKENKKKQYEENMEARLIDISNKIEELKKNIPDSIKEKLDSGNINKQDLSSIPEENWNNMSDSVLRTLKNLAYIRIELEKMGIVEEKLKIDKVLEENKVLYNFLSKTETVIINRTKSVVVKGIGGEAKGFFAIMNEVESVGIGRESQYSFNDGYLSKKHGCFYMKDDKLIVEDLNSRNGSFLNGTKFKGERILLPHDRIRFGHCVFQIEHISDPLQEKNPDVIGLCEFCQKKQTKTDLRESRLLRKKGKLYCLECLDKGKGDFKNIKNYRVIKKIGSGGMSEVYVGVQPGLARFVAVKLMKDLYQATEDKYYFFCREARISGEMEHPNIVRNYDVGYDGDKCYIAMELVQGSTIDSMIKKNRKFSEDEIIRIFLDLCDGLIYIHKKKIIHRDIKPSNIFIDIDGTAKFSDFGVSKYLEKSGLTAPNAIKGTLRYMPPEQCLSPDTVDERSDIYSLGVTIYELCTGFIPIKAESVAEYFYKVLNVSPNPISGNLKIAGIIYKCLEKEPENRFQNAYELKEALEKVV